MIMTQEEFKEKVYSNWKGEFVVEGTYTGSMNPIKIRHSKCGRLLTHIKAGTFTRSRRKTDGICPYCNRQKQAKVAKRSSEKRLQNMKDERKGKRYWQNSAKMYATCVEYKGANDITVKFDNGRIAHHKQWRNFVIGNVAWDYKELYVGKNFPQSSGLSCKCVAYRNATDADFEFENGEKVYHREIADAKNGTIAFPSSKFIPQEVNGIAINSPAEFSRKTGISKTTVHRYLNKGMSLQEIKDDDSRRPSHYPVTINGKSFSTRQEACKFYKIPPSVVNRRKKAGYSDEDAFLQPLRIYLNENRVYGLLTKHREIKEHNRVYHSKSLKSILNELETKDIYIEYIKEFSKITAIPIKTIERFEFDFVIVNQDGQITHLVEYDGEFHFQYIKGIFKSWERFVTRCESDIKKNMFAKYSKIPLLRIRYDQIDQTEEMLNNLFESPSKYIEQHNTFYTENDYWDLYERASLNRPKATSA